MRTCPALLFCKTNQKPAKSCAVETGIARRVCIATDRFRNCKIYWYAHTSRNPMTEHLVFFPINRLIEMKAD